MGLCSHTRSTQKTLNRTWDYQQQVTIIGSNISPIQKTEKIDSISNSKTHHAPKIVPSDKYPVYSTATISLSNGDRFSSARFSIAYFIPLGVTRISGAAFAGCCWSSSRTDGTVAKTTADDVLVKNPRRDDGTEEHSFVLIIDTENAIEGSTNTLPINRHTTARFTATDMLNAN